MDEGFGEVFPTGVGEDETEVVGVMGRTWTDSALMLPSALVEPATMTCLPSEISSAVPEEGLVIWVLPE